MVPVVSFVGFSGSGKTILVERIISKLKENGLRVAVIKHAAHGFDLDKPGKDSWRFSGAGSDITVLTSPGKVAIMEQTAGEPELETILKSLGDKADIVLVEGYKKVKMPKIEVRATLDSPGLPCNEQDLIAIIVGKGVPGEMPVFDSEEINALVRKLTNMAVSTVLKETVCPVA